MGLPLRDDRRHTYREYCTWPQDVRYELIDGIAYAMAPAPVRLHQEIVGELFGQIRDALKGHPCRVYVAPFDVRLPRGGEADDAVDTVVQPDIAVICDAAKLDARGCRGAPDWIVEVLSPATAAHDQFVKRELYERRGVAEYWLVHPHDRLVLVYRLAGGAYGKPDGHEFEGTLASSAVPAVTVDLGALAPLAAEGV